MPVGRNDPCPCGSGKKYKHCCLRADRARRAARREARGRARPLEKGSPASEASELRDAIRQAAPFLSQDQGQELSRVLELAKEIEAYEELHDEIEAASLALEDHRAEFTAMMQRDPQAMVERADALFSEERFAQWRWHASDVHRAFEAVGYPQQFETEEMDENIETMVAATLHLADSDLRMSLARRLTMLLPEYVAEGRYLDAWLIQYSGFQMVEAPDKSNPFLFVMFQLAYDEWADQIEDQQKGIMRQFGLDAAQVQRGEMSFADLESRLQEQMADPETRARLEAYYAEHPMLREQAEAEVWNLERKSLSLLEREDAGPLYLSPEEVAPWLEPFQERLEPIERAAIQAIQEGRSEDDQMRQDAHRVLLETSQEMAADVFTPERIEQLAETLRIYGRQLSEAGEKQAALWAQGARLALEHEPNPTDNPFLIGICLVSLRAAFRAVVERAAAEAQQANADE